MGNDFCNSIWEAGITSQKGWKKPSKDALRREKEEWIKSKYMWKGFIKYNSTDGPSQEDRDEKFSRDLYKSAKEGNLFATAEAIAKGANVNWKNEDEGGKTALHICSISKRKDGSEWKGIETAEFLLQNGAKMDTLDMNHHSVLDIAGLGDSEDDMMEYLTSRYSP